MRVTNNRSKSATFMYKDGGKTIKVPMKPYETLDLPNFNDVSKVVGKTKSITNFDITSSFYPAYSAVTEITIAKAVDAVDTTSVISETRQVTGNFEIEY